MNFIESKSLKVAILDLYQGVDNQGMRCIREILNQYGEVNNIDLIWDEFEVRLEQQIPDLSYDIYISTGGPGSPLESEGTDWERKYFKWLGDVEKWNGEEHTNKKFVFFICHSFQLVCRHWKLATVCERKSTSFGVFPIHLLEDGVSEVIFKGMPDPFYAVDSRDWQVIEPRMDILYRGAKILCIEKERPHVPLERAIMAMRFNDYFFGTQFHPEADAVGMSLHLQTDEKKTMVIENYGIEKWQSMIESLNDPAKISFTYAHVIPNFLNQAVEQLHTMEV